jgi:hypothetical protein
MTAAAFYTVSDPRYFLGAVGMINSLRLAGHREPTYLLDCGLEDWQREALEGEVQIVPMPEGSTFPAMLKGIAPLEHPADVMVQIDADMLVTRSLEPLIETAAEGRVVAFEDYLRDRFVPEWGDVLGLGELRRQPYLCAGLVAMAAEPGETVLKLRRDLAGRVDLERTVWGGDDADYPVRFPDQDIFNAVLAGGVEPERVAALEYRLAPMPPFGGLELLDARALRCEYPDGVAPYLLHHTIAKPWLEATVHWPLYSRLLRRTLNGDDVAIKIPPGKLPLRMRTGPLAYAQRKWDIVGTRLRWRFGGRRRRFAGGRTTTVAKQEPNP